MIWLFLAQRGASACLGKIVSGGLRAIGDTVQIIYKSFVVLRVLQH